MTALHSPSAGMKDVAKHTLSITLGLVLAVLILVVALMWFSQRRCVDGMLERGVSEPFAVYLCERGMELE